MMKMTPARTIDLFMKNGQITSVEISTHLVEKVKESFSLESTESVTDVHIKHFLIAAMKNAVGDSDD
jgi:hypothetical protein